MKNVVNVTVYGFMELNLKKWKKNKNKTDMLKKAKETYKSAQVPFLSEDIDYTHRSGMEYMEKNSTKKLKYIIMKFKSWDI